MDLRFHERRKLRDRKGARQLLSAPWSRSIRPRYLASRCIYLARTIINGSLGSNGELLRGKCRNRGQGRMERWPGARIVDQAGLFLYLELNRLDFWREEDGWCNAHTVNQHLIYDDFIRRRMSVVHSNIYVVFVKSLSLHVENRTKQNYRFVILHGLNFYFLRNIYICIYTYFIFHKV